MSISGAGFYLGQASASALCRLRQSLYRCTRFRVHGNTSAPVTPGSGVNVAHSWAKLAGMSIGVGDGFVDELQAVIIKAHIMVNRLFDDFLNFHIPNPFLNLSFGFRRLVLHANLVRLLDLLLRGLSQFGAPFGATDIHQEGLRIPPVHLLRGGQWVRETRELFLANTRVTAERLGDLEAQVAALRAGAARMQELASRFGRKTLVLAMRELQQYSRRLVLAWTSRFPKGQFRAEDFLDDDGTGMRDLGIRVVVQRRGNALEFDFRASDREATGPVNANLAITTSCVFYAVACVAGRDIPANSGMMEPVRILTRPGSIVDCRFPSPVAGGNVETTVPGESVRTPNGVTCVGYTDLPSRCAAQASAA